MAKDIKEMKELMVKDIDAAVEMLMDSYLLSKFAFQLSMTNYLSRIGPDEKAYYANEQKKEINKTQLSDHMKSEMSNLIDILLQVQPDQ